MFSAYRFSGGIAICLCAAIFLTSPCAEGYDWLQFNRDAAHRGDNEIEKKIDRNNVGSLTFKYQATLPATADGPAVLAHAVATASGLKDLLFVTTTAGDIVALDARTGAQVWSKPHGPGSCTINSLGGSACYTTSSPAASSDRRYVYSYGLDGYVHQHQAGDGTEVLTGGWPQLTSLKPYDEKGSAALAIATSQGVDYLYVAHGGYPGDNGDYQGHVTAINLATGSQNVFNTMCSDQTAHLAHSPMTPNCASPRSAVWARPSVVYDASLDEIFMATGNGIYTGNATGATGGKYWSETIFSLRPDATGAGGMPLDSYTPDNFQSLDNGDADLGSTAPALLPVPATSTVQHLAVQAGKDGKVRLVNLANMSGQGGVGHTGGELGAVVDLPQGPSSVFTQPAVWVNPDDGATWVFVTNSNGIAGLKLQIDGSGAASLLSVWHTGQGGSSPVVANNIVYYAASNLIRAIDPTSGSLLWSSSQIGGIHWQSPIVANGVIYVTDQASHLTAFAPTNSPAAFDFDGNGRSDLIWQNGVGQTALWLMNGLNSQTAAALMTDASWQISQFGDFNGDRKADVVWRNAGTGQTAIWIMNGASPSSAAIIYADPAWSVVGTGDFNGDGKSDLLWRNAATGQTAIWLMNGVAQTSSAIVMADPNWIPIGTGDFNGDGKTDLLWHNTATGQTAIWLMSGVGIIGSAVIMGDAAWSVIQTGDFDGDGKTDLLWQNSATGQTAIWLMDGLRSSAAAIIYGDASWRVTAVGDFNADGMTDLVWHNDATGQTAIWLMNGLASSAAAIVYGDPHWMVTATGDFNGDGNADLIWRNAATGQTALWLMNGISSTGAAVIFSDANWRATSQSQ